MDYIKQIFEGKPLAMARMISMIERRDPEVEPLLQQLYKKCGRAHIVGITGPPGAGKSCLVAALIYQLRKANLSVAVLAVDPSSPFTGGALLGDRARMVEFSSDPEIFIRSLATRGFVGGLSEAVNGAVDVFDAAGKDVILIETVGVGQNEIDIVNLAHTVILALVPGHGDGLQAMKAGIMEVGDILVVNKADLPGAQAVINEMAGLPGKVEATYVLKDPRTFIKKWQVPITQTVATKRKGSADLISLIGLHYQFLKTGNQLAKKNSKRRVNQFMDVLSKRIRTEFASLGQTDPALKTWIQRIENLQLDPYQASEQVINFMVKARKEKMQRRQKPSSV